MNHFALDSRLRGELPLELLRSARPMSGLMVVHKDSFAV
jgi:hypothetical protein